MHRPVEILVVEDNPADANLAREALVDGSVPKQITVVPDGPAALDYIFRRGPYERALRPDIVLLDLNLPKQDGLQVLRAIKTDPVMRAITVIVLTSSPQPRDVNAAYETWANCYIVKPMDLEAYFAMMRGIEEFWMSCAALPTFNLDPRPSLDAGDTRKSGSNGGERSGSATAAMRSGHRGSRSNGCYNRSGYAVSGADSVVRAVRAGLERTRNRGAR